MKKKVSGKTAPVAPEATVAAVSPAVPIDVYIGRLPGRLNKYSVAYGTTLGDALEMAREYDDKIPEIDLSRGDKFEIRYNAGLITQEDGTEQVLHPMDTIFILKYIKGN